WGQGENLHDVAALEFHFNYGDRAAPFDLAHLTGESGCVGRTQEELLRAGGDVAVVRAGEAFGSGIETGNGYPVALAEESGHEVVGRVVVELTRRPGLEHLPVFEDEHLIGE